MIGGIIGDIVGSVYECVNHKSKDFEFFPKYALYGIPREISDKAMEYLPTGMRSVIKRFEAKYGGIFDMVFC